MRVICLVLSMTLLAVNDANAEQRFAELGALTLESGAVLENCRVGFRTFGTPNADRSNVVVFPTWFGGTAEDLERYGKIGPGLLADTGKYYVIAIDALGNGVSSSPSNVSMPDGEAFPVISIRDMVDSQHRLLTEELGLEHVDTVMGISMGGMQAFEWAVMYPSFMDNVVALDGSPKMMSYDLIQWQSHRDVILALQQGGFSNRDIGRQISQLSMLTVFTPDYFREAIPPEDLPAFLEQAAEGRADFRPRDYVAQLEAMIGQDVYRAPVGGVDAYAGRIAARMLVVGAASDHMVNPGPGRDLAAVLGAGYLSVDSPCGHVGSSCEQELVNASVAAFLDEE